MILSSSRFETYRYLMTSIGQFRSLTWGHLRSRSRGGSDRSCCISADAPWRDKHFGAIPMSVSLFNQRLLIKRRNTRNTAQCAPSKGHLWSPELFLGITFDWIEIQTRGLYHWVCCVKAHGLICNMAYMNQHMTLTWDDLRSNFEIDLSRSSSIYFEPARRAKHIDVKIMVLTLILHDLFTKNYFHIKRYFDLWWLLEPWILT